MWRHGGGCDYMKAWRNSGGCDYMAAWWHGGGGDYMAAWRHGGYMMMVYAPHVLLPHVYVCDRYRSCPQPAPGMGSSLSLHPSASPTAAPSGCCCDRADVSRAGVRARAETAEKADRQTDNRQQATDNRQQATDIRHQTSDIRHQTSDIRHQTSGIRHQASDIRHQASGIRW